MKHYIGIRAVLATSMNADEALKNNIKVDESDIHKDGYCIKIDNNLFWLSKSKFESKYKLCETPLESLEFQFSELSKMYEKFKDFISGDKFDKKITNIVERRLLFKQVTLLSEYLEILKYRIKIRKEK